MICLTLWATGFVSFILAVTLLHFVYREAGTDLGLDGVGKELVAAIVASACQAGLTLAILVALNVVFVRHVALMVVAFAVYRLAHWQDMEDLEAFVIAATQRVMQVGVFIAAAALTA